MRLLKRLYSPEARGNCAESKRAKDTRVKVQIRDIALAWAVAQLYESEGRGVKNENWRMIKNLWSVKR